MSLIYHCFTDSHSSFFYGHPMTLGRVGRRETPLYKVYGCMCHPKGYSLLGFGVKKSIDFAHYGLKSGMVSLEQHIKVFSVSAQNE